jgi:hypothetical protein
MHERFSQPGRKARPRRRNFVNKRLLVIALALPLLLMTAAASAQAIHVRVNIPFNFIAAGTTLPAGQYDIQTIGTPEKVLAIRDLNSSAGILVLSNPLELSSPSSSSKLVFHRYGSRYFLAQLWMQGYSSGYQVTPTSRETEVSMDIPGSEVVVVMALR